MTKLNARPTTGQWFSLIVALTASVMPVQRAAAQDSPASARWLAAPVAEVHAAAERGEAAAQHALGERLLRGRGGKVDVLEAYRWTERAAAQDWMEAQLRLGVRHEQGIGCPVDWDEAHEWFQRAAGKSEVGACLAMSRLRGSILVGARHDSAAALEWLRKAAAGGELEAHWRLAKALPPSAATTPELAATRRKSVETLAQCGDAAAQAELGYAHVGAAVTRPTEPEPALYWFRLAMRVDPNPRLRTYASFMVKALTPEKVAEVDRRVAAFKPAAPRLLAPGVQSALFLDGPRPAQCAPPESVARVAQTRQRAESGDAAAQFQLALAFHHSDGWDDAGHNSSGGLVVVNGRVTRNFLRSPPKHHLEAARWYRAAATNGIAEASRHLDYMAVNAQLADGDLAFAVAGMQARAAGGSASAQHLLANLHLAGRGVPRNDAEAFRLLTSAAQGKERDAMHQLGMIHHTGGLVPVDLGEAARWLRLAAQDGHPKATRQMAALFGQKVTAPSHAAAVPAANTGAPASKAPRLALVPMVDALRPMSDLLTAAFSAQPGVTLLERAEIERVIREQSLTATFGRDPLKLGQLLGADGVVLLETNSVGTAMMASVRLVAVGPGVVLGEWLAPFPVADAIGWSARVTADAAPHLRKLAVPRAQATPVSVIGLRMAVNAPDAAGLQQGLSRLLAHRLTQERELFVLERQRIERLGAEKELVAEGETSFWSGSHLIDGTIEPDLNAPVMLKVRLHLASPGGAPALLTADGVRTNLGLLADTLAGKVLAALRKTPTAIWQPEAEAQRFWEEAVWARRWNQWRVAAAAMEAAWALGLRGSNHAAFRMELLLGSVEAGKPRWPGTADYPALLRQPPDPANLEFASRALEASHGQIGSRTAAELGRDQAWLASALKALATTSQVLDEFYHAPEYRPGREEDLARLRAEARNVVALLQTIPGGVAQLNPLQAAGGRLWLEGPDEVLALHRRLMSLPGFHHLRGLFVRPAPTPLTAWQPAARLGLHGKWQAHLESLARSTNAAEQIEGLISLAFKPGPNDVSVPPIPEKQIALRKVTDAAWVHREALFAGRLVPHTWQNLREVCFSLLHSGVGVLRLEREEVGDFFKPFDDRMRDYAATLGTARAINFLRTSPSDDREAFIELITLPNFNAEQAREILPEVHKYWQRTFGAGLEPLVARLKGLTNAVTVTASTGTTTATKPATQSPTATPGATVGTPPVQSVAATPGTPSPDALRVSRFWLGPELRRPAQAFVSFPLPADHNVEHRHVEIHDWLWREDRLWLAWRHALSVRVPGEGWVRQECSHVVSYSLPGFEGDLNADGLPAEVALARNDQPWVPMPPGKFEVLAGRVYVSGKDGVWRMSKPTWEKLPIELEGTSSLFAVHGRLIISAPDVLYAYDPKTGTTELLASARRRPVASAADGVITGLVQAGALPSQRMRIIASAGRLLDYDFTTRKWDSLPSRGGQSGVWQPDWVAMTTPRGNEISTLHLFPHAGTNWQLAAFRLPPPPRDLSALSSGVRLPGTPLWLPGDRDLTPVNLATTSHSNRLWSITGMNFHLGATQKEIFLLATNGCHVRLAAWHSQSRQPAVIPLWLELPPNTLAGQPIARARSHSSFNKLADVRGELLATPPGLVYRNEAVPGFWFIPWGDVLPRVETEFAKLAAASAAREAPGNHRGRQLLHTYDANEDGKVSPSEFAVLFSGEKMDADANASRRLSDQFNRTDGNRDGGLDGTELSVIGDLLKQRASGAPPTSFGPPGFRPAGFPPGAGMLPRPGQMPAGPPPPEILERYDKNKNGMMDPDEMQELFRDQARGTAPKQRSTNAPPSAPAPAPQAPPAKP